MGSEMCIRDRSPPKLNERLLAYAGYACGDGVGGGSAARASAPDMAFAGSSLSWGRLSPRECAIAVASAEGAQPFFAWSEATSMCASCSAEQLRKRSRSALYNIYHTNAFVAHAPHAAAAGRRRGRVHG